MVCVDNPVSLPASSPLLHRKPQPPGRVAPDRQAGTVPWVDISREPRWEGLGDRAHAHHSPPADLGFLSIAGMLLEGQGVALEGQRGQSPQVG